ncbi:putative heterokaryon incompatibility protein [Phaeoacremonium minimum UCRPA7]|uniref:Putative heterokaryon incompatibility protein n=1 Tax=Phaeoacremonium minimum (strain UCR-PA7) TaxID=1286976 RepID=R8BMI2_PHAM7|nr:putative heterokaryon incompatibility protein [Phaeoacremonium minimum UCRPA7]EOO00571.1 putative heterokaryon incompatibility protein [Phaeoacremonium minimum UCRPA7]
MALCISCENIQLPIVTNGQAADGHELHRSVAKLTASARTCRLCALFLDAISGTRLKGIRHDAVRLFPWASDAAGDPVGLSRVFVRVGDKVGRFVNVHAEPDSAAARAGFAIGRPMSAQCDFELLQQWLSNCCTNHSCSIGRPPEGLPARFIKINNEGMVPELHLVSSRDVSSRYAALSYCWGGNFTGIKTTKATLEQHHTYIEPSRLPKTIRDATQITRALGIEYLWVDSLCIVQDDQEDWAAESKRMAALYQSAVVTLVATAAKDANQGCLFPRNVTRDSVDVQLSVDMARDTSKVTFTNHTGSIADDFLESPWNKRAWCLQEYVLSPRMLHFFENRIVWQCRGTLSAEDFVELRRSAGAGAGADFRVQHILTTPSSYFSLRPPADLETWFRLVEYSPRGA